MHCDNQQEFDPVVGINSGPREDSDSFCDSIGVYYWFSLIMVLFKEWLKENIFLFFRVFVICGNSNIISKGSFGEWSNYALCVWKCRSGLCKEKGICSISIIQFK